MSKVPHNFAHPSQTEVQSVASFSNISSIIFCEEVFHPLHCLHGEVPFLLPVGGERNRDLSTSITRVNASARDTFRGRISEASSGGAFLSPNCLAMLAKCIHLISNFYYNQWHVSQVHRKTMLRGRCPSTVFTAYLLDGLIIAASEDNVTIVCLGSTH